MNFIWLYVRIESEKDRIFEKQLETIAGKTYPMGIEELILEQERKAGEKRGETKGILEIILSSYDNGLNVPIISNITGLSEKEVEKILKEKGKIQYPPFFKSHTFHF